GIFTQILVAIFLNHQVTNFLNTFFPSCYQFQYALFVEESLSRITWRITKVDDFIKRCNSPVHILSISTSLQSVFLDFILAFTQSSTLMKEKSKRNPLLRDECSNSSLSDLPQDVIELDNNIHEIDVSENGIEIIDMSLVENDAFVNATKLKEVNVSNNEITELSPDVFRDNPNLLSVDVSRNHIICIHKDVFSNLKKIVEIHAGSNKMTFIDPDTFRNNPDLTELTVSWNNIEEIHPKTFKNNPNLEYVNFRSNKIKSLSSDTFNDNPKLKSIDLRSNSLVTIERGTFLNNPQLEHLLLSKNEHVRFHDGFKIHSTVLKVFDVEHCNLTNMPAGILEEANSLKELNLANNNLTSLENITDGYSETMTELEILDLSNNNLQTITIDVFSNKLTKLKELRIAGNAFLCNCTLRTLWLWAQKQGLVPAEPQIMCSTGMNIIAWDELRNYNCSSEALMETDESLPLTNIIVDSKPSNSFINLPSEKQPENNKSLSHPSSGLIKEHKYHPQNKTEHAIDEYHGHEDEFYDFEDSVQDIGRSNRIMIGISLSILLVVVFIIIPVIFIMRRKNGLYKITKPMKKPFDAGATEQKSAFTAPPAI
ncbi:hypothetical protein L9F63_013967, partial [Diploptera punctata]